MKKEEVLKRIKIAYKNEYNVLLEDKNYTNKDYITLICNKHGSFTKRIDKIKEGHCGCQKCSGKIKKTLEQFIEDSNKVHNNFYQYNKSVYIDSHTKLIVTCPIHGDFEVTPTNHIDGKTGCPKCKNEKIKKILSNTKEEFINKAKVIHDDKYDYSEVEYINNTTNVLIKCPEHGLFIQTPNNHLKGEGCPKCIHLTSKWENEIVDFIKSLKVDYEVSNRTILDGQEIDIFIPSINLGIECNGLYWHSEKYKPQDYHYNKMQLANQKGIHLLQFYEDEWNNKQDIVKSIIRNKLKINTNIIYARKCEIREVNNKDSMEFLNKNHIQGHVNSFIKIGLYYENKLVSLMTFGKTRVNLGSHNQEGEFELLRFCNEINISVIGAASKLFRFFIKNYDFNQIKTFCDLRYSQGNIYDILGFTYHHTSKPNYFYVINHQRENRFKYRKDALVKEGFDSNKTEHQIMLEQEIYRIYDCGCNVYYYK